MRGETWPMVVKLDWSLISIHSPHAGRDLANGRKAGLESDFNPLSPCGERRGEIVRIGDQLDISIHSPHAGRDEILLRRPEACKQFQSTLPMRGETVGNADVIVTQIVFQSTLPMRGETPPEQKGCIVGCISIHSPHAGRDQNNFALFY